MDSSARRPSSWAHGWWLLVGVLLGLGVEALLTIGVVLLLIAVVLGTLGVAVPALRNRAVCTLPAGVGLAVLYLAWLNRAGPGTVCTTTSTSTTCVEQWAPWPFLVGAAVLFGGAIGLARALRHQGCTEMTTTSTEPHNPEGTT